MKSWLIIMMILSTASIGFSMGPEDFVKAGRYEEAIEAYRKALTEAQVDQEKARLHKALGDLWALKEDFKKASKEYLQALSLDKRGFSEEEKFQMAVRLSWGKYLDEAIEALLEILKNRPDHLEARIHLARCLSWSGRLGESLRRIEEVLQKDPENRDALFIQANVLRWRGEHQKAKAIYQALLREKEDFDVRLGLTYLLLSREDRKGIQESVKRLKPLYPYQEREFKSLTEEIQRRIGPILGGQYQFYKDSDHNRLNRYSVWGGGWVEQVRWRLQFRHTGAEDRSRRHRSEELSFGVGSRIFDSLSLGGGLGITQLRHRETDHDWTGHVTGGIDFFRGAFGVRFGREVLVDTAELIENRIRVRSAGGSFSQNIGDRLSLFGSYFYRSYSDSNRSHDVQWIPRYTVLTQHPRLTLGYRFRYLDFDQQTRHGYFDPENFIAHHLLFALEVKEGRTSFLIEPHIGYQSYKRYGRREHDFVIGGAGAFEYRIGRNLYLKVAIEGGNDASDTASGFKYYQTSLGVTAHF